MEIDHIFMLIAPPAQGVAPELTYFQSLGLTPTYERHHPGQGTQNLCFCFDNLFVELLWICSADEARSERIARTRLYERSGWRANGTNPFGISWRRSADALQPLTSVWRYDPPYLPPGASIDVAADSDDPRQPMMFKSPGGVPPIDWPAEKKGGLQHVGGWGRVLGIELLLPSAVPPSPALESIAAQTMLNLQVSGDDQFSMTLLIENRGGTPPRSCLQPLILRLPV